MNFIRDWVNEWPEDREPRGSLYRKAFQHGYRCKMQSLPLIANPHPQGSIESDVHLAGVKDGSMQYVLDVGAATDQLMASAND